MVCSACGFDSPPNMRFCGMCGMPLPHRPLTTPGAQSTLTLTRVPVESAARERSKTSASLSQTIVPPEKSGANGDSLPALKTAEPPSSAKIKAQPSAVTTPSPFAEPAPAATQHAAPSVTQDTGRPAAPRQSAPPTAELAPPAIEAAPKELVPDVPFEEYVQSFHYDPPSDPSEITMRGDAPAVQEILSSKATEIVDAQHEVAAPKAPPESSAVSNETARASATVLASASTTAPKTDKIAVAGSDTMEGRLGLQSEAPAEAAVERPRFLDIAEPPKPALSPTKSSTSGTSIVGPSFLGLSDPPVIDPAPKSYADYFQVEDPPRTSHTRLWVAAAVVLIFAVLGFMEWRSQVNQTDNGPVEIVKTKVRKWTHGGAATAPAATNQSAASSDTGDKPEMQVQEQPKTHPAAAQTPAGPANANPATASSQTSPVNQAASAPQQPSSSAAKKTAAQSASPVGSSAASTAQNGNSNTPTSSKLTQSAVAKPTARNSATTDTTDAAKTAAGADELARAKNASDSAAAAAWLWKSTAKGNPDAPVLLANMYMQGDGVPRSCEQAVVLLKTAAAKENARARNKLASMYASGDCVQRNRVEAYRWLSSALVANPNSEWAQQNRDLLWQQMTPEERAMAEKYR